MIEISIDDLNSSLNLSSFASSYQIIENIGNGAFGKVVKAINKKNQEIVAVKILNINKSKSKYENIKTEANIMKDLNHINIVKYLDYFESGNNIYIVMEYLDGGTLKQYIENNKDNINENIARIIIKQILNALSYLHYTCNICHRDVKPDNIMFSIKDDINSVKLLDFGLSTDNFESKNYLINCGTLSYMAPEQISNNTYSKAVDIWSVGIILYMMLNKGKNPFYTLGESRETVIKRITYEKLTFDIKENPMSKMAQLYIKKLLEKNHSYRYTARPALNHPWITLNKYDKIPMTMYDQMKYIEYIDKMKILLYTTFFLKSQIIKKKSTDCTDYEEYEKRVKITNKQLYKIFKKKRNSMFVPNNINHNEMEDSSIEEDSISDEEGVLRNLKNSKTINCYSKKKENNIKSSKTLEFIKNCKRLPDINHNNINKNKENNSTTNDYISNIPRKINTIKLVIIGKDKDKKSNLIKNHVNSKSKVNFKMDLPYLSNIKDKNEYQNRKSSVGTLRKYKTSKENSKKKINSYQSRSISNKIRDKK